MTIKIIGSYKNAHNAKGLVVIIDVLRAFTTASYVFENKAKKIIVVAEIKEARQIKKENPNFILMGERGGKKLSGFEYCNSPLEIQKVNFKNKTIILTTSAGTQGIIRAVNAKEIIAGAFVNAQAIIDYIKIIKPKIVSLVCTDNRWPDNEDFMLAKYIKGKLTNKEIDFSHIKKHLINHPCAYRFLKKPIAPSGPKDFYLALDLDRFNFVVKAEKPNAEQGNIVKKESSITLKKLIV